LTANHKFLAQPPQSTNIMENDYRRKLSQQLDRLYIATGNFGSSTLVSAPTTAIVASRYDDNGTSVPSNGACFAFAHDHIVVQFFVVSDLHQQHQRDCNHNHLGDTATPASTFQLSTAVYRMPQQQREEEHYFETLHELLMKCRQGLLMGHVNWSAKQDLTIQLDLPLVFLEQSHYQEFELSMKAFMTSYWKVRSNLSQYYAGKTLLFPTADAGGPALQHEQQGEEEQSSAPQGRAAALQLLKPSKKESRSFRVIRRILPNSS
jgi:hypothetical protein